MSVSHGTGCFIGKEIGTEADPGKGLGGPWPPLILRPKYQGLDDRPLPPPLSEGLNPPLHTYINLIYPRILV